MASFASGTSNNPKRQKTTHTDTMMKKCVDTIRVVAAEMPGAAKSGHPGAPIGCAPMAHVLFGDVMNFSPANPAWPNRDRFVLSNGHACALLYTMLHLTGYEDVSLEDLKNFRQLHSKTAGHPENFLLQGIEVSTGPLGQGICNAVGMAMAEKHLAAEFNAEEFPGVVDNFTYVICGDGCLQEGVSGEASSLAGHLGLGKLIILYDDNLITIDGDTSLSFTEDVLKRYEAYGWHTQTVADGNNDLEGIKAAVLAAKAVIDAPSIIKVRTTIGLGSKLEGTHSVHGAPLKPDDMAGLKQCYGFNADQSFHIPQEVSAFYAARKGEGKEKEAAWNTMFAAYATKYPEKAAEFQRRIERRLPDGWRKLLPTYTAESKTLASRKYSAAVLGALVPAVPEMIGGSADLTPSNGTHVKGMGDFQKDTPAGRYLRFGVREHGMAAICNGIHSYGGIIPYCATFLTFTGYAMGAIRLSALSQHQVIYVMTHDSIGLGEDGPTHQPIEHLASLRSMPNIFVFRPADGNETSGSYAVALEAKGTPSVLALSRQNLPNISGSSLDAVAKGAYIIQAADGEGKPDVAFAATGSEVSICCEAAKALSAEGIRAQVISMPCWKLFEAQSTEYKQSVFTPGVPVLGVEAASATGWHQYSHANVTMSTFGKSAPGAKVFQYFGFTPDNLAAKAKKLVSFYAQEGKHVPALCEDQFA